MAMSCCPDGTWDSLPQAPPTPSSPGAAEGRKGGPSVWPVTEALYLATVGEEARIEARGVAWAHVQG